MSQNTPNEIDWSVLSEVERLKYDSNYLRGTLVESLENPITGAIADKDNMIIKFHGMYQQFDRDTERERKKQKLEPEYSFLIRVRLPGGITNADQWLKMDELASAYANNTLKLTTRQAFQLHGVIKWNLRNTIKGINSVLLDTIAACGDVNRNVMSHANPALSPVHRQAYELAKAISGHLLPQTRAYHEIWLEEKLLVDSRKEVEPIYGDRYLPRKFKMGIAVPPENDVDVFSQDLGFIAIVEHDKLIGFNVAVGGGLGSTFGLRETYPRLADVIGFCTPEQAVKVAEKVVLVQRDFGNRQNRKLSRLKYTIDKYGVEWFKQTLNQYLGFTLTEPRPYTFKRNGDEYGWKQDANGKWNLTLFVEGGRVRDFNGVNLKQALRQIALQFTDTKFILTGNQNLILCNIEHPKRIDTLLEQNGVKQPEISGLRKNSIACVALNTCGLAFAEAERYLPSLIDKLDTVFAQHGLQKDEVVIRMTGCPNGCGRPYLAEIGFIGKSAGRYNLYLGGNFTGTRLNTLYKETLNEDEILATLSPIIVNYGQNRELGEHFGDFVIRKGYVSEVKKGSDFVH